MYPTVVSMSLPHGHIPWSPCNFVPRAASLNRPFHTVSNCCRFEFATAVVL